MRGEVEGGVARSDVLLDSLDAGAVALLESLDGLENHLRVRYEKTGTSMGSSGRNGGVRLGPGSGRVDTARR